MFYIYKIIGVNYIGSTNGIKTRTRLHNSSCYNTNSRGYNYLIYQYIREKEIDIELEILGVYKKECSKRIQLLVEQFYINKYDSVNNGLNNNNAFGDDRKKLKQHWYTYRQKNIEKVKKKDRQYYHNNKEKINKKINCSICNSLISKQYLKRHQRSEKCLKAKNNKISQNEIDFKYNQTAYNEEGEFMNWY